MLSHSLLLNLSIAYHNLTESDFQRRVREASDEDRPVLLHRHLRGTLRLYQRLAVLTTLEAIVWCFRKTDARIAFDTSRGQRQRAGGGFVRDEEQ